MGFVQRCGLIVATPERRFMLPRHPPPASSFRAPLLRPLDLRPAGVGLRVGAVRRAPPPPPGALVVHRRGDMPGDFLLAVTNGDAAPLRAPEVPPQIPAAPRPARARAPLESLSMKGVLGDISDFLFLS